MLVVAQGGAALGRGSSSAVWERCQRKFQRALMVLSSQTAGSRYEEESVPLPPSPPLSSSNCPSLPPPFLTPSLSATKHLLHKTVQESALRRRWHWIAPVQPWSLNDLHAVSGPLPLPCAFVLLMAPRCAAVLYSFMDFLSLFCSLPSPSPSGRIHHCHATGRRWTECQKAIPIGPSHSQRAEPKGAGRLLSISCLFCF